MDDGDTRDRIYGGKGGDKCYVDSNSEVVRGYAKVIKQKQALQVTGGTGHTVSSRPVPLASSLR